MLNAIWTDRREHARSNEYVSRCVACRQEVHPSLGRLVSKPGTSESPSLNKALHPACDLPEGWLYRASRGYGETLRQLGYEYSGATMQWSKPSGEQAEQPVAEPASPTRDVSEEELTKAAADIVKRAEASILNAVPALVKATMHEATRTVEIKLPGKAKPVKMERTHKLFTDILIAVTAKTNPFIVGPAGSGKTTLCMQVAEALGMKFYMSNSVAGKHELLGFRDAHGQPVHTDFYKAFKTGGLFLFDEADNSNPNALVAMNSAIANGICEFAGEMVKAHKDFQVIASANTFGRGADSQYVGRNKLDAATLDRFQTYIMDYDEELELALAGDDDWVKYVQQVRAAIYAEKIHHVVSPRASIAGARLLAAGMERTKVVESCVWKGLDNTNRARVTARIGG